MGRSFGSLCFLGLCCVLFCGEGPVCLFVFRFAVLALTQGARSGCSATSSSPARMSQAPARPQVSNPYASGRGTLAGRTRSAAPALCGDLRSRERCAERGELNLRFCPPSTLELD